MAKRADKGLVYAKTRVCDLVIELLTLFFLSAGGETERERETGRNSTTKLGQTTRLMRTSI